jgi:hypothetical protein
MLAGVYDIHITASDCDRYGTEYCESISKEKTEERKMRDTDDEQNDGV